MNIKEENTGSMLIMHIDGEIDLDKTDDLRAKVGSVIDDNANVQLDLTQVNYIDSSGVAVLIETNQKAQELSKEFSIKPSEAVLSVLKMAKLDSFFKLA